MAYFYFLLFHQLSIIIAFLIKRQNIFNIDNITDDQRSVFYRKIIKITVMLLLVLIFRYVVIVRLLEWEFIGKYSTLVFYLLVFFFLDIALIGTSKNKESYNRVLYLYAFTKAYKWLRVFVITGVLMLTILSVIFTTPAFLYPVLLENKTNTTSIDVFNRTSDDVPLFNGLYAKYSDLDDCMQFYKPRLLIFKAPVLKIHLQSLHFNGHGTNIENFNRWAHHLSKDTVFIGSYNQTNKTPFSNGILVANVDGKYRYIGYGALYDGMHNGHIEFSIFDHQPINSWNIGNEKNIGEVALRDPFDHSKYMISSCDYMHNSVMKIFFSKCPTQNGKYKIVNLDKRDHLSDNEIAFSIRSEESTGYIPRVIEYTSVEDSIYANVTVNADSFINIDIPFVNAKKGKDMIKVRAQLRQY